LVASDANDEISAIVDSTITDNEELEGDSTLSEEEISPIAQTSPNTLEMETPSIDSEDDEDGLACLDKIRSLLESGKSAKSKLSQIKEIINSSSGGKKKSRKIHKNHKKGKHSRKRARKGSCK